MQRGHFQSHSFVGIWKPTQYWWCHELQLSHSIQENTSKSTGGSSLKHMHVNHSSSVVIFAAFFPLNMKDWANCYYILLCQLIKELKSTAERDLLFTFCLLSLLFPFRFFFLVSSAFFAPFLLFCWISFKCFYLEKIMTIIVNNNNNNNNNIIVLLSAFPIENTPQLTNSVNTYLG